jgi:hypothetical protein
VQKDLLVNTSRKKHACEISTRSGASTQDPLYPEGHPKRIEQDSQRVVDNGTLSRKKKKKHKMAVESSECVIVYLSLMLKLKAVMLLINKLKRNQKSLLRVQSTPRKISLPINIVVRENLKCKNQCLFLIRNTNQRKKSTITSFVNG